MRRFGHLFEHIADRDNLREAYSRALRRKRHRPEARLFGVNLDANLKQISAELLGQTWRPEPFHHFMIHDPKERLISAPTFRDRVVHHAIMRVCDPVFERRQIAHSYACRVGKGRVAAVEYARKQAASAEFFLKMDVRRYFDSVSHDVLLGKLSRLFKDQKLMELFETIIVSHGVGGRGLPIGSLTSQHFANFYLVDLDHLILQQPQALGSARYMDDIAVWGRRGAELRTIEALITEQLGELRLVPKLSPFINRTRHGMDWLGYRVYADRLTLNRRSRVRFRQRMERLESEFEAGLLDEASLQRRVEAMVAFTLPTDREGWKFRQRLLQSRVVSDRWPRTV